MKFNLNFQSVTSRKAIYILSPIELIKELVFEVYIVREVKNFESKNPITGSRISKERIVEETRLTTVRNRVMNHQRTIKKMFTNYSKYYPENSTFKPTII